MKLPKTSRLPNISPTSFKWLIMGDSGTGKSSLIASQDLWLKAQGQKPSLILDPDRSMGAHGGFIIDSFKSWEEITTLPKDLEKEKAVDAHSWLCIDNLNIFYEFCAKFICRNMGISDLSESPKDVYPGTPYARCTNEFASWLLNLTNVGLPILATCHVNMVEASFGVKKFNKWVPAFAGGGARSTYGIVLRMFDIIGFLTPKRGAKAEVKDIRKATTATQDTTSPEETEEGRTLFFEPTLYWVAADTSMQLPPIIELSSNWKEDWSTIMKNWRAEK